MFRPTRLSSIGASFACTLLQIPAAHAQYAPAQQPLGYALQTNNSGNSATDTAERWRIIHTPGINGAADMTAILHVADIQRSDQQLAGLMLRCSKKGVEAIIVVVEPFPPQAHPKITLRAGAQESYFEGSILATGVGLVLPTDGMQLALGPWREASELFVKVYGVGAEISGVIQLTGLVSAIQPLAECAAK